MLYNERLRVPFWWWLGLIVLAASLAVAVFAYVDWRLALGITLSVLLALVVVIAGYGHTLVAVTADGITAGRARIDGDYIGAVEALDPAGSSAALGPQADHQAFLLTRPYIPTSVRIEVVDHADPHPYWLVSSRHPQAFVEAVARMRQR